MWVGERLAACEWVAECGGVQCQCEDMCCVGGAMVRGAVWEAC